MGKPMNVSLTPFTRRAATPTPLLAFIAGPHAANIARVWPAPHMGFLALPSARRHAAAVLLERRFTKVGGDGADILRAVEFAKDADLARLIANEPRPGLMKAFARLGEVLWNMVDYDRFLSLFASDEAGRVLRHMDRIQADRLALIGLLPAPLRLPRTIDRVPHEAAARDLARAFERAGWIDSNIKPAARAKTWDRKGSDMALFDGAAEALKPTRFDGDRTPPVLPAPFERVTTLARLVEIALEFQNCLRDFIGDISAGRMAIYVWRGSPDAVMAVRWDPAGWRVAEVETRGNGGITDDALRPIIDAALAAGLVTGGSTWTLAARLHAHICAHCGPAHMPPLNTWRERLELGTLWD
jgi:hypothetical protein